MILSELVIALLVISELLESSVEHQGARKKQSRNGLLMEPRHASPVGLRCRMPLEDWQDWQDWHHQPSKIPKQAAGPEEVNIRAGLASFALQPPYSSLTASKRNLLIDGDSSRRACMKTV